MQKYIKKNRSSSWAWIGISIFVLALFASPDTLKAMEEKEVKAAVSVEAVVPTTACAQYSSFTANVTEILADSTQKVTLTAIVKDCTNVAIEDALVTITSNRGGIDKIDSVDSNGNLQLAGDGLGISGETDSNGYAFFEAYSGVPGEALFSAKVDSLLNLNQIKVTFLPLPFPKSISVALEVPRFIAKSGVITLFQPKAQDIDKGKLVNMTMELRIPIWVFYFTVFVIFLNATMFVTILILLYRIRKIQKVEMADLETDKELLEKEEKEIETIANKS